MSFGNCRWLAIIYKDPRPEKAICKASQVGLTEFGLVVIFDYAEQGRSGMYVLPTDQFRNDWNRERFNPTVAANPPYKANLGAGPKGADSVSVKQLFGIPWKFVGSLNRRNFFGFPADVLIVDEYDLANLDNLAFAEDRLGRSDDPRYYKYGNPSIPQYGIDREFMIGDAKEWFIKCERCNHWQIPDWFSNVVRQIGERDYQLRDPDFPNDLDPGTIDFVDGQDARVYCSKCDRPIDRLENRPKKSCYVAAYPGRRVSSYRINRIFGDVRDRAVIAELYFGRKGWLDSLDDFTALQRFYNNVLAIPFRAPGSSVTRDLMESCTENYRMPSAPVRTLAQFKELIGRQPIDGDDEKRLDTVAGVDVGKVHNIHISTWFENRRWKLFVGRAQNFREIKYLAKIWNVAAGVIDNDPETELTTEFVQSMFGWYRCKYVAGRRMKSKFKIDYSDQYIQADRTQSMDASYQSWARKEIALFRDFGTIERGHFVNQMESPVRLLDEKSGLYFWSETKNRPDHDRHADTYERMAVDIFLGGGSILEVV